MRRIQKRRRQRPKMHVVTDLVRTTEERAKPPPPDKPRITLPGLRFMGQELHPAQLASNDNDDI